jgi:hypothetical protein
MLDFKKQTLKLENDLTINLVVIKCTANYNLQIEFDLNYCVLDKKYVLDY